MFIWIKQSFSLNDVSLGRIFNIILKDTRRHPHKPQPRNIFQYLQSRSVPSHGSRGINNILYQWGFEKWRTMVAIQQTELSVVAIRGFTLHRKHSISIPFFLYFTPVVFLVCRRKIWHAPKLFTIPTVDFLIRFVIDLWI